MTHTQTQVNSASSATSDNTPSRSARLASLLEVTAELRQDDGSERTVPFAEVTWHDVADSDPLRTFHAYKGRLHYDGLWWSSGADARIGDI